MVKITTSCKVGCKDIQDLGLLTDLVENKIVEENCFPGKISDDVGMAKSFVGSFWLGRLVPSSHTCRVLPFLSEK